MILPALLMCSIPSDAQVLDIGSCLELMVDDYLIDEMTGATLELHQPVSREIAIDHNESWEGNICCGHTVFQDGDIYRMHYRGRHYDFATEKETHHYTCYAESTDGIHWVKPSLGIVEHNGSTENNIIITGGDKFNLAPFKDTNPSCEPDARYKAFTNGHGGVDIVKSPDAIHWTPIVEGHVITEGAFDSLNLAFWDPNRSCYVDYHRGFRDGIRDIMTCTSDDFIHWTKPEWISYTGAPTEHLYTNAIKPYYRAPHILMGVPKRFVPERFGADHPMGGVSDAVFMTSRDGLNFRRWGEAFIRPGPQKERWVNRNNYPAWGIVETPSDLPGTPNELSVYTTEGYYQGDSTQLRRHSLRMDGFVSVNAPRSGGEMRTKPFIFSGSKLVINFSTSAAGGIRVEVQSADGSPIDGFSLDDCPEIFGDSIERAVAWTSGSDLTTLAGQPIRLRFTLSDADLYSLRFQP